MGRKLAAVIVGYVFLWYVGAMFDFFPFSLADDLSISASAYSGLLVCIVAVLCAGWIVQAMKSKKKGGELKDEDETSDRT